MPFDPIVSVSDAVDKKGFSVFQVEIAQHLDETSVDHSTDLILMSGQFAVYCNETEQRKSLVYNEYLLPGNPHFYIYINADKSFYVRIELNDGKHGGEDTKKHGGKSSYKFGIYEISANYLGFQVS